MLDFSWSELLVVIIVAILAIGPQQIPDVLYRIGRIVRRLQYMRFALSKQFEDFMEKSDLEEMRKISDHVRDEVRDGLRGQVSDQAYESTQVHEANSDVSHHDELQTLHARREVDSATPTPIKGVPPIAPFVGKNLPTSEPEPIIKSPNFPNSPKQ